MIASDDHSAWPSRASAGGALALLNFAYLLAFADRIVLSLLAVPIQRDLGLSDTQLGLLTGVAFGLSYTLLGLPAGYLADRTNRRNLIIVGVVIWSIMTGACGLVGTFMGLFIARIGVGLGEAVLHPNATSLIADYFPPERRPRAYAIYMMAGAAGTFFAFLLGGKLLASISGLGPVAWPLFGVLAPWKATFISMAVPGLILGACMVLFMREPVRRGVAEPGHGASSQPDDAGGLAALSVLLKSEWRMYVLLMLGVPLLLVGSYSLVSWLPVVFQRVHGWQPVDTAVHFALTGGLSSIVGTLVLGKFVEWLRARGRADATFIMCLGGGLTMNVFAAAAMMMPTPELALSLLTVAGFFLLAPGIAAVSCVAEIAPNRLRAKVSALFTLLAGLITNTAGPFLVGFITDRVFGDPNAINLSLAAVMLICGSMGALMILGALPRYRRVAGARVA